MEQGQLIAAMERASGMINTAEELRSEFDRRIASRFSIFDATGAYANYYNERHMSEVIRLLLDPKGSHGQKDAFLKTYLERFAENEGVKSFLDLDLDRAEVITEWCTRIKNPGRFIDIHVKCGNKAFAIETKIWAGDQQNQVADYLGEKIEFLIYLSPYNGPDEISIKKDACEDAVKKGKLLIAHYYSHIIPWLEECIKICQADKVKWYLQETIDLIKIHIYEENPFMSDFMLEKVLLKDRKIVEAYYSIKEQENDLQKKLVEHFFKGLENAIKEMLGFDSEWKPEYYLGNGQPVIEIKNENFDVTLYTAFDKSNYKLLYYCLHTKNISEKHKELFRSVAGKCEANTTWGIWKFVEELHDLRKETMLALYDYYAEPSNSKMAGVIERIVNDFQAIIEKLESEK